MLNYFVLFLFFSYPLILADADMIRLRGNQFHKIQLRLYKMQIPKSNRFLKISFPQRLFG